MAKTFGRYLLIVACRAASACTDLHVDVQDEDDGAGESLGGGAAGSTHEEPGAVRDPSTEADAAGASISDGGLGIDAGSSVPQDAGALPRVAFTAVYPVLEANCLSCHGAGKTLDMSTIDLAYAELVGVAAEYKACIVDASTPKIRVVAGDPGSSLLIEKLGGTPSCGKQMPPSMLLPDESVALLRSWIEGGAARD